MIVRPSVSKKLWSISLFLIDKCWLLSSFGFGNWPDKIKSIFLKKSSSNFNKSLWVLVKKILYLSLFKTSSIFFINSKISSLKVILLLLLYKIGERL